MSALGLAGRGRRLAAATAGLRKASELFAHSCPIYSHNEPLGVTHRSPTLHYTVRVAVRSSTRNNRVEYSGFTGSVWRTP